MISNWAGYGFWWRWVQATALSTGCLTEIAPLGALYADGGRHNILRGRAEPGRGSAPLGAPKGSVHRHVVSEPHRLGASQLQRSCALTASRSPGRGTVLPNLNNAYSTNATKNPAEIAIQPPQPHEINLASTLKNIGGRSLRGCAYGEVSA
jgi:hypothetical protein